MRRIVLAAVFALSAAPGFAQDYTGFYDVQGTNLDGSGYSGTATVAMTSSSCTIDWVTGSTTSNGICMVVGDTVAAAYSSGSAVGLVLYGIGPDGTLSGIWTIEGVEGTGTEILTPQG